MKKHLIRVSAEGLTSCPSCKQHMTLDVNALEDVTCPFCGAGLTATLRAGKSGSGVMDSIRSSRSGLVAAMLGASLTVACSGGDDNNDNHTNHDNHANHANHNHSGDMSHSDDMSHSGDMHHSNDMHHAEDMAMETTPNNDFVGDYGIAPGNHHTGDKDMGEETDG